MAGEVEHGLTGLWLALLVRAYRADEHLQAAQHRMLESINAVLQRLAVCYRKEERKLLRHLGLVQRKRLRLGQGEAQRRSGVRHGEETAYLRLKAIQSKGLGGSTLLQPFPPGKQPGG